MTFDQLNPETATYPAAPWVLQGKAIQSLQPLDIDQARSWIPSELEVVPILPGKTLGGIYLSTYEAGSVMEYHELIVMSGLVRYVNQLGIWVSHIYVDNPDSVAGGQQIWGLPKQMAEFQWREGSQSQVEVSQDGQRLCRLTYGWQVPAFRQPIPMIGTFSTLGSGLVWFASEAEAEPHLLVGADLQVPPSSPLASLNLDQPWLMFYLNQLMLKVEEPRVEGASTGRPNVAFL
jgi:hypothetical protein